MSPSLFDSFATTGAVTQANFIGDRRRKVLIADLFCGAGGSSTGAMRALRAMGIEPVLTCCNHWPTAIETHKANHPEARHFIEDLSKANPLDLVPEGYLDLLMASPTCTHHSRARGGKPTSDQERSDPYHILKWLTDLRVSRLMIENVPEMMDWGPVDAQTGRPIKSKKGVYFRAWIQRLKELGFTNLEYRVLNAADYGDGTSRHRFFLLARSDGQPVVWPEPTHSAHGEPDLFGNGKQKHRGAREFINWEDQGKSIFDRPRPLAGNTIRRIATGLVKFSHDAALPYLHVLRAEGMLPEEFEIPAPKHPERIQSIQYLNPKTGQVVPLVGEGLATPIFANTAPREEESEAPEPIVFQVNQGNGRHGIQRPVSQPIYTVVTRDSQGLAVPKRDAFVCANRMNNVARGLDEPIPVVTTAHGGGLFLASPESDAAAEDVQPFMIGQHGGATPRSVDEPVPTITTDGYVRIFRPSAQPFVLNRQGGGPERDRSHAVDEPMPTATCRGAGYLVECSAEAGADSSAEASPYLVNMKGQSTATSIDAPAPTLTAHAAHLYVAQPCVVNMKKGAAPVGMDDLIPTMTAHSSHLAIAEPCLVVVNHGDDASGNCERRAKSLDAPLPTVTTNPSFALAQPNLFPLEEAALVRTTPAPGVTLPVSLNERTDLLQPFVTPYYGSNVGTDAGADSVDEPLATITAQANKHGLCQPAAEPFLTPYYGVSVPKPVAEPIGTITTKDRYALCEPFLTAHFGERANQTPRVHSLDDPMPTVTSRGGGELVQTDAEPLLVQVDQTGSRGPGVRSVDHPLPTIVTKQNTAIVEPFIVSTRHVNGGPVPRTVERPLPTITGGGSQVAVVEPTQGRKPESKQAKPRTGRLVWINGVPQWLDVLFRMLRNPELAAAMGFNLEGEDAYAFCGTQTEITKQIGNAVPVGTATALVSSVMGDMPKQLRAAA